MSNFLQIFFSTAFLVVIVLITIAVMAVLTYVYRIEAKLRRLFILAWLILFLLHFIGLVCVYTSVNQAQNRMIQILNILSDHFILEFPVDYATIPHNISRDDPLYLEALDYIQHLQDEVDWIAAVYTFQEKQDGNFVLVLSPAADLNRDNKLDLNDPSEMPDPPGTPFRPDSSSVVSKIKRIFHEGEGGITEPYSDHWGRWISIFRPLYNSDGNVCAIFAIDFWGNDWEQTFFFARVWPTLFYESFLIYFFFQFGLFLKHRTHEKNLRYYSFELEKLLKEMERIQHQLDSSDRNKREFLENIHDVIFVQIQQLSESMTQLQTLRIQPQNDHQNDRQNDQSQNQSLSVESILDDIHETSSKLLAFLDNIHIYSTIDLTPLPSRWEEVPLKDLFQVINDSLNRHLKQEHSLDLTINIDEAVPDNVLIHFQFFIKIIMELLSNAIRFTQSGKISLRVLVKYPDQLQSITTSRQINENDDFSSSIIPSYLFLNTFEEEPISDQLPYLKITVSDTGCGIGAKHLETLFKPFHRQDNNNSFHQSVLTFGLCTAKRLTQIIGGRIWVESHPKHGSSFSILLPFALPASQQPVNKESVQRKVPKVPVRPLDGLRILVVNESVANQVFITTILIEAGATTECVNSGADAIKRIGNEQQLGRYFDLILMDSYMLQMSGYQVIYEIRNQGFMHPVILLGSAFDMPPRLHPVTNNAFVSKPIDRQRLIQTITSLTKNKRPVTFAHKNNSATQNSAINNNKQ